MEALVNTGAVITLVGTAFTSIAAVIVGWFVRRTDRAAKLTQAYMDDAGFNMQLVGALRDDYWGLADWAYQTRSKWHRLLAELPHVVKGDATNLNDLLTEIGDLPTIPNAKHRELERQHNKRPAEDADSG